MSKPAIAIFSSLILPPSETFIKAQGEGLQEFTSYYIGSRRVKGLDLPIDRTCVVNQGGFLGKAQEGAFKFIGVAPKVTRQLRQIQPQLIHAHFGLNGALALPIAKSLSKPLVVTFHGADATVKDEYARKISHTHRTYLRRRETLKQEANSFIAISEFIQRTLIKRGFPPEKIVLHYIGIDTVEFQPDASISRQPIVLFVGRLVEKKGCEYLIRAMSKVQAEIPEVELVIIGDGPLRNELQQQAKTLLRRYQFLGIQPPQVVKQWLNKASVFSVPSIVADSGDAEGFGLVFTEAQAMGLPVVSFASGGISEAVAHGETGFLAPEKDWKSLSEYIVKLLGDASLWQQYSQAGQVRVRTKFNLHKQTKLLEEIYRKVVQKS